MESILEMAAKGAPKSGGRKLHTPNKVGWSLRELAQGYTKEALETLVAIMIDESEAAPARVSAANAILDRGYGKPSQPVDGDGRGGSITHKIELIGISPA